MKRRYKTGDWLRVPLGGEHDAVAIVARACRSRLFGYFFAIPATHTPAHGELRAFREQDAIAAMLFGGSPIEHGRWPILATSLAFDERRWPFPAFVSRGAFGEAWTRVRYDPHTLQVIERSSISAEEARDLPDARFADAHEVETALRQRIAGEPAPRAHSICEVRSPLDGDWLRAMENGGTIQFSTPLNAADIEQLRAFIESHPGVRLRVHGFRHGFDATQLRTLTALRDLAIDVHRVAHVHALTELRRLRRLRVGALPIDMRFIGALTDLQALELRGTRASLEPLERHPFLQTLILENTRALDFRVMASAERLRALTLAHGNYDLQQLSALAQLRRLELRGIDAARLPPFEALPQLTSLTLCDLPNVTDLGPIARACSLQELRIAGMPHLNVRDFEPLKRCAGLKLAQVDVGSRRKTREIYRLLDDRGNR